MVTGGEKMTLELEGETALGIRSSSFEIRNSFVTEVFLGPAGSLNDASRGRSAHTKPLDKSLPPLKVPPPCAVRRQPSLCPANFLKKHRKSSQIRPYW